MKKFLCFALALVMTIGAFAQSQIAAHRLDVAKETKKEFKLNSRNLDPSNLKKLVLNETKAMSIDIDIVTIEALSVEVTFTPNDEVAAYYYLVADPSIVAEYLAALEMYGVTEADVVMMLAENADAPAIGVQTLTLSGDFMTPSAENVVYAVGVAADESVALFQETFTAESLGGSGDAMVTIDIPADSVTAISIYASITPNDQTAYYKYIIMDQSMLTEAQWNNDSIMAYLSTQSNVYAPISGTISDLMPNMTLAFYAIAYNADGVASDLISQTVTTSSLGGTGLAEVAVDIEVVDGVATYETTMNDQTAYFYFAVYYGIENATDEQVLQSLESDPTKIQFEDQSGEIDFATAESDLLGIFIVPLNANEEVGTTVAIRFTADGLVGLQDVNIPTLNVYPNPANSNVTITSSTSIDRIEISNMLGQVVFAADVNANSVKVNTAEMGAGNYLVKMYTEAGMATKKLVVE